MGRSTLHVISRLGPLLLLALGVTSSWAAPQTLQFTAIPPAGPAQIFGSAWTIYADGEIDSGAPVRLDELLADKRIPPNSALMLNSPGGNLLAGIELGRTIRAHGLNTYVNAAGKDRYSNQAGECYSACSLAFLGGRFRYVATQSIFGVHRFYAETTSPTDRDTAQILSAAIVQYVRDMGVDPAFFTEMTKAGRTEVNILPTAQLLQLGVVNNGIGPTNWSIESVSQPPMLYLKGERDTAYGINKFMIVCPSDSTNPQPFLHIIFDPQGRTDEIKAMTAQSLMVDGQSIPISRYLQEPPRVVNGWVNADYAIPRALLQSLVPAHSVGVTFQHTYSAPIFLGFDNMDFASGGTKLAAFLASCR